jgi:AcrR family transcriptional regulator
MSELQAKILNCACDLYGTDGPEGFSMRQLARRVGVTAPALYRYYRSKEHVIADVVRQAHRDFTAFLYRALEGRTPHERFMKAVEGYLDFALEHPRRYCLLFIAPDQLGMEQLPEDIEAMGSAVHQFWVDRVRERMDEGALKEGDPKDTSLTMWAHAHGMISLYHHGHFRVGEAEFRKMFLASSMRMMMGVATERFAIEVAEQRPTEPAGASA